MECSIHSAMKHENVIQLYEYAENETELTLMMEYANDANYFERKIEESLTPIMNQEKL